MRLVGYQLLPQKVRDSAGIDGIVWSISCQKKSHNRKQKNQSSTKINLFSQQNKFTMPRHILGGRGQGCPTLNQNYQTRDFVDISISMNTLLIQKRSSDFVWCVAGRQQKIENKRKRTFTKQSKQERFVIFAMCTCAGAVSMLIIRKLKNIRNHAPKNWLY